MTGTFIDTIIICSLTALVILTTDVWTQGISAADLTAQSIHVTLGDTGAIIVALCTVLFAFSSIIGWCFYGEKAFEYLFGSKSINIYRLVFVAFVYVGATVSLALVWDFADLMNGLMAIPNLIGIFMLGRIIKAETDRYFKKN